MTDVLVLNEDEAGKVRGRSPKDAGHALDPIPLKDGRYYLGPEVLDDPAHEDVRPFLAGLPREPIEKLPTYGPDDEGPAQEIEVARLATRAAASSQGFAR